MHTCPAAQARVPSAGVNLPGREEGCEVYLGKRLGNILLDRGQHLGDDLAVSVLDVAALVALPISALRTMCTVKHTRCRVSY